MLKITILLIAFIVCAFGATIPRGMLPQATNGRIIGGAATTISEFPWQVSVQRNGAHICGGTLYRPDFVITAAHCLQRVAAIVLRIRAGSTYWNSGGILRYVADFKNHERFSAMTLVNDIAIIRLELPLNTNFAIKPIGLAAVAPVTGADAVVSGWGITEIGANYLPSILHYTSTNILDTNDCAFALPGVYASMICASSGAKDACQSDSGGPLVSGGLLVGVVSWGRACAAEDYPSVYANVAVLKPWIEQAAA